MAVASSISLCLSVPHGNNLYLKMYERAERRRAAWHQHSYVRRDERVRDREKQRKFAYAGSQPAHLCSGSLFVFYLKFRMPSCALSKTFCPTNFYAPTFPESPEPYLSEHFACCDANKRIFVGKSLGPKKKHAFDMCFANVVGIFSVSLFSWFLQISLSFLGQFVSVLIRDKKKKRIMNSVRAGGGIMLRPSRSGGRNKRSLISGERKNRNGSGTPTLSSTLSRSLCSFLAFPVPFQLYNFRTLLLPFTVLCDNTFVRRQRNGAEWFGTKRVSGWRPQDVFAPTYTPIPNVKERH